MTTKNYLMVQDNTVYNVCVWNGDTNTWTPPTDTLMLVQEETPAMLWFAILIDNVITGWELKEFIGQAGIGFTWDGTVCTTNQPKPAIPIV